MALAIAHALAPHASAQPPTPAQIAPPVAQAAPGGGSRYVEAVPVDFNDHAGWLRMFDGTSLQGWDGPTDLWRVENGVIVVAIEGRTAHGTDVSHLAGR